MSVFVATLGLTPRLMRILGITEESSPLAPFKGGKKKKKERVKMDSTSQVKSICETINGNTFSALHSSDDCQSSDELEEGKCEIYLLLTFNSYAV